MKRFAQLFRELDETQRTSVKTESLVSYFRSVPAEDAVWAVHLLCGRRPRRVVRLGQLRTWCAQLSGIPDWLFEECYQFVGDLSETISLLLPTSGGADDERLHVWMEQRLPELQRAEEHRSRELVTGWWADLDVLPRFVFNKLLTGGFRVGVSQGLVMRALSHFSGVDVAVIAHRLMGTWQPSAEFFQRLTNPNIDDTSISRPYPFCLAHALPDLNHLQPPVTAPTTSTDTATDTVAGKDTGKDTDTVAAPAGTDDSEPEVGGTLPSDWIIDWKWDGIRAQMIRRQGQTFLWSRGEELVNAAFPELISAVERLPDGTVLDGEIVVWQQDRPAPFAQLQRRIGRRTAGARLLREVPVRLIAFDLLEVEGRDIRQWPLRKRRRRLLEVLSQLDQRPGGAASSGPARVGAAHARRVRTLFDDLPLESEADAVSESLVANSSQPSPREVDDVIQSELATGAWLQSLVTRDVIVASPDLQWSSWSDYRSARAESRRLGVEGLMLKDANSVYGTGRVTGLWWKWKVDPFVCDAVLVYAQRGHGRRSGLFTDYTFAAWDGDQLVPFAKAYSGLSQEQIQEVDQFVQKNTLEKFGPVMRVRPELVFELAFERLQRSSRHKSGIAVRFPRIVRPRTDKSADEADTLDAIRLIASGSAFPD